MDRRGIAGLKAGEFPPPYIREEERRRERGVSSAPTVLSANISKPWKPHLFLNW